MKLDLFWIPKQQVASFVKALSALKKIYRHQQKMIGTSIATPTKKMAKSKWIIIKGISAG